MTVNGILNIYKEAGMTSHDVVFKLRKILQTKKIGHGGTLDPDVTGVLPIAVGKATRVIEYMTEAGKIYEGQVTLGFSTETEDASGTVVASTPVVNVPTTTEIDAAMADWGTKGRHRVRLPLQTLEWAALFELTSSTAPKLCV